MATRAPPVGFFGLCVRLPGRPEAARAARAFVRGALSARLPVDLVDTAQLLVSELVTNAIQYAGTALTVHIARTPEMLRLAVNDGAAHQHPRRSTAAVDAERGRGLCLIQALAADWGVREVPDGKHVWCALPL
jgi:anti-sigma regulatory factor (Ser/Thr protein kinase)